MRLYLDLETYSGTELKVSGVHRYVEDPDFRVLMVGWALDDNPIQVSFNPDEVPGLRDPKVIKVSHNTMFDRTCLGPDLDPAEWDDTQARAGAYGYPQSLEKLAEALGAEPKDSAGSRLIRLFCKPPRRFPEDHTDDWLDFIDYCEQDVSTLREVDRILPALTPTERAVWVADQRINDRGIKVDVELAAVALETAEENRIEHEMRITELTGIVNPSSQPQMLSWLKANGLPDLKDLQADTLVEVLEGDLPDPLPEVIALRQELAGTATKKFQAALHGVCSDGRLRGGLRYFGAHTGRWTGRGVQLQNLPRASISNPETAILDLMLGLGAEAYTLKALVRAMFVGPFTVVDYASIEARVLAWLATERWALEAFYAGRDIYVETQHRMRMPTRTHGKIAVLALGYNGGLGSLRAMGAEGSDGELQVLVEAWRTANPAIVALWKKMEEAFYNGGKAGRITVEKDGKSRALFLPSGRAIWYHSCKWDWEESPYGPRRRASFRNPLGGRAYTYGGRLCENVTQAVARDILAEALVRLEDRGYLTVAHVHDEAVLDEAPPIEDIVKIMCELPDWAKGLPVDAEGFITERYRKA